MKRFLKRILFPNNKQQKILTGPAKGMYVRYDINHRSQHLSGLYEREIYPYLKKGMNKSNTLIDIGANDGYYVMAFLKTGKRTIACEPADIANEILSNAKLNGRSEDRNLILERRLVGMKENENQVSVDELVKDEKGMLFFLVDIDGGEFELLKSCGNSFDFNHATWLIETHSRQLEDDCINFLKSKNYKVTIIKNAWWRRFIPELRPLAHNRWIYAET